MIKIFKRKIEKQALSYFLVMLVYIAVLFLLKLKRFISTGEFDVDLMINVGVMGLIGTRTNNKAWIDDFFDISPYSIEERKSALLKGLGYLAILRGILNSLVNIVLLAVSGKCNLVTVSANILGTMIFHFVVVFVGYFRDTQMPPASFLNISMSIFFAVSYFVFLTSTFEGLDTVVEIIVCAAGIFGLLLYGLYMKLKYRKEILAYYCEPGVRA